MKKKPEKILHFCRRGSISVRVQTSIVFNVQTSGFKRINYLLRIGLI